MVDREVTDILEEIKNRVRSEATVSANPGSLESNGKSETPDQVLSLDHLPKVDASYLNVMERAWDRLPPVFSARSGTAARIELWIKSKFKTALRWFTWEQANFNFASYKSLSNVVESLNSYQQELTKLHQRLTSLAETNSNKSKELDTQLVIQQRELESLRNELKSFRRDQSEHLQAESVARRRELNEQRSFLNAQRAEFSARQSEVELKLTAFATQQTELSNRIEELGNRITLLIEKTLSDQHASTDSKLAELVQEFRERDERLLDEQRVCFKQLALELSEFQVLQDRVRRDIENRISQLKALN